MCIPKWAMQKGSFFIFLSIEKGIDNFFIHGKIHNKACRLYSLWVVCKKKKSEVWIGHCTGTAVMWHNLKQCSFVWNSIAAVISKNLIQAEKNIYLQHICYFSQMKCTVMAPQCSACWICASNGGLAHTVKHVWVVKGETSCVYYRLSMKLLAN